MKSIKDIATDKKQLYIISAAILCALLLSLFLPVNNFKWVFALLLSASAAAVVLMVKKRSILSINKKQVILLAAIIAVLYVTLYYLTGIYFGFFASPIRLSWSSLVKNIFPISLIIIAIEIIRAVLVAQKSRLVSVIAYISCVIVHLHINCNLSAISTLDGFMDIVGMTLLPALSWGLLFHYLAYRYGMYPNIILGLTTALYAYLIPYVPAMPEALAAFLKLVIPLAIYLFLHSLYEKKRFFSARKSKIVSAVCTTLSIAFMISIVMLISCQFRYGLMVIGSSSMTGELNVGDAIIYERYDGQAIEKGQVIVYQKNNSRVIHRVVDIQIINGETRIYTKGDANPTQDTGYITPSDIVGVTETKIAYIGYPTVWLTEIFEKQGGEM